MVWLYTERVSTERQALLGSVQDFGSIAKRIYKEMEITCFRVIPGREGDVKDCRRPEFALRVDKDPFDLFFNSPHGYRGQYRKGEDQGDKANADLISLVLKKLLHHAEDNPTEPSMSPEELGRSLEPEHAKIWIKEQEEKIQLPEAPGKLIVDLEVEPWLGTAKQYVATPDNYPDPNRERNAVAGVRAPEGTVLEVKGAFLDDDGQVKVAASKTNRGEQIRLYGYTGFKPRDDK